MLIPAEDTILPTLFSFTRSGEERVFISTLHFAEIIYVEIGRVTPKLEQRLAQRGYNAINENRREGWMNTDKAFEKMLRKLVKKEYPFLTNLIDYEKLSLILACDLIPHDTKKEVQFIFGCRADDEVLWTKLLGLTRGDVQRTIDQMLPFWHSIPIIRTIVITLRTIFQSKPRSRESEGEERGTKPRGYDTGSPCNRRA